MEEFEPQEPTAGTPDGMADEHQEQAEEATEESMGIPFGLVGATFLCNLLQYAVFLGLTMVLLVIIRIFAPQVMPVP